MRLNSVKAVSDAALIPRDPTSAEQFSRAMTLRSKRPAFPAEQRFVSLPANDRTFFAPPRLRHEFGLDRPYQQHSWTYAIIRALAGPISQIPLVVKYGDRSNPQTVLPGMLGYEFQELFDHPHLQLTSTELKEFHVDHLSLAGECISIKVGADADVPIGPYEIPKELYPFSGREFDHVMDPARRRIIGYLHRQPGKRDADAYLAHEVCVSRYANPYYPLRGLAPHEAGRQPTQSDWKQMQYNEAFLDNDASAGVVLVSQTELSRSQQDELREAWDERHRGYRRRRRTTVLEGGIDVRNMGTTHVDMDFVNLAKYNVEQLCAVYKVPDAEINNYKNLNFATAEAIKTQFWNNTLLPIMTLLEEAWYSQIMALPGRGRFWVEFDRSKIDALVENELTKLETAKVAMDMGVPFNQVNERYQLGMKKQAGWGDVGSFATPRTPVHSLLAPVQAPGDGTPFGKPKGDSEFPPEDPAHLPHVPGTPKTPASGGSGQPGESSGGVSGGQGNPDQPVATGPNVVAAEPEVTKGGEAEDERPAEAVEPEACALSVAAEVIGDPMGDVEGPIVDTTALELNVWLETRDAAKTARWEQYLRFLRPREKAFHKRYGNYLHQLRKHQLARLDAFGDDKIAAWANDLSATWRAGDVTRLIQIRKEIDDLIFDLALWNQRLVSMMHGLYISISDDSVNEALKELGVPPEAGHSAELRTKLLDAIHEREKILAGTNDTLRADLYKEMERSLEAGETRMQMAQRIKQVFNLSNGQAMRIARTETGAIASAAKYAAHQSEGLEKHEWLTARDERVRHTHRAQDGTVVDIGAPFPNGLKFPLDPEGPAEETINCFPAGTPVLTADGEMRIEDVRSGDLVLTHRGRWKAVVEHHISVEGRELVEVVLDSGRTFRITPAHKLFVVGRGWVEAGSLQGGDELVEPSTLPSVNETVGEIEHPHPELLQDEMSMGPEEGFLAVDLNPGRKVGKEEVNVVAHPSLVLSAEAGYSDGLDEYSPLRNDPKSFAEEQLLDRNFPGRLRETVRVSPVGSGIELSCIPLHPSAGVVSDPLRGDGFAAVADGNAEGLQGALKDSYLAEAKLVHELAVARKFLGVPSPEESLERLPDSAAQGRERAGDPVSALALHRAEVRDADAAGFHAEGATALLTDDRDGHEPKFTRVAEVRQVPGLHQVFNLGVDEDMSYFAAGVLGRNCRCTTMPVLPRGWTPASVRRLTKDAPPVKETP